MAWDPVKEAKKWFNKVKNEGESAIKQVKTEATGAVSLVKGEANSAVERVGSKSWEGMQSVEKYGESAISQVDSARKTAISEVKDEAAKAKRELEHLPDTVKKELQNTLGEIAVLAQRQVYKKAAKAVRKYHRKMTELRKTKPALVDFIDAQPFELKLGPATLLYSRLYDRAEKLMLVLDRLANEPPKLRRSSIIAMFEATGPDLTDLGISVDLAALVVSSESLGGGFKFPAIPLVLVSEFADWLLEEIGVPE